MAMGGRTFLTLMAVTVSGVAGAAEPASRRPIRLLGTL